MLLLTEHDQCSMTTNCFYDRKHMYLLLGALSQSDSGQTKSAIISIPSHHLVKLFIYFLLILPLYVASYLLLLLFWHNLHCHSSSIVTGWLITTIYQKWNPVGTKIPIHNWQLIFSLIKPIRLDYWDNFFTSSHRSALKIRPAFIHLILPWAWNQSLSSKYVTW